jgi:phage tail protein X
MIQSINYTVKEGERWDSLAWKFYGSVKAMDALIEANPTIPLSAVLPAGMQVIVPILDNTSDTVISANLPPWKR